MKLSMKNPRLWLVKRRMKASYHSYLALLQASNTGCLLSGQQPTLEALKGRCNRLLDKLAKLEPNRMLPTSIG